MERSILVCSKMAKLVVKVNLLVPMEISLKATLKTIKHRELVLIRIRAWAWFMKVNGKENL